MRKIGLFLAVMAWSAGILAGTTGNLKGTIRDEKNEPVVGATVVATSPALQGEITAITDEHGLYIITELPPGKYRIAVLFDKASSQRNDIDVSIDKTIDIDVVLKLTGTIGEVYTILDKAPSVDVGSSTLGVTLSKEFLEKVPLGTSHDFTAAVQVAPTADGDFAGTTLSGATSPENNYVVDGMSVNDPSSGLVGGGLITDFIEEFEVKEGGYGPEFGRATGGFINAVTKSGGNEFHGSAFVYYTPSFLAANPREIPRAGSGFSVTGKQDYQLRLGFEVGGPIIQDKLWFEVGYAPLLTSSTTTRNFNYVLADTNNAPLTDDLGNLQFGFTGQSQTFKNFDHMHEALVKVTHLIDNNNRHSLSFHGMPDFANNVSVRSISDLPFNQSWNGFVGSAIYHYTGNYLAGKFKFDGSLGASFENENFSTPTDVALEVVQESVPLQVARDRGDFTGVVPTQCADFVGGSNPPNSCMVPAAYGLGGAGLVETGPLFRFAEKAAFTTLFSGAGLHQLKFGIDFEQLWTKKKKQYSGGGKFLEYFPDDVGGATRFRFNGYGAPGNSSIQGHPAVMDLIDSLSPPALATNYGVYAGDTWNPINNLTLNYGLRWEVQALYGSKSFAQAGVLENKFTIWDNLAPRVGLIWDFTNKGRGAVRLNYGRFYESIPLDMMEREFGHEVNVQERYTKNCFDGGIDPDGTTHGNLVTDEVTLADYARRGYDWVKTHCQVRVLGNGNVNQSIFGAGNEIGVQAGLKGQFTDEVILSADYEPFDSWVFSVGGVYRELGNVIEDMSVDGAATYFIGNPGSADINKFNDIRREILTTSDPAEQAKLQAQLDTLAAINTFPHPVRKRMELRFQLDKKLSDHFAIMGSYVMSWTYGNYPGLVTANNGQIDPNITTQFDLPVLLHNRMGFLQQDRRHNIKLQGYYTAALSDFGICFPMNFTVGMSAVAQSGTPYDILGNNDYGPNEVFILPRGTGGRLPWAWAVNLNLGVGYQFAEKMSVEVFAGLYNITNNQVAVSYDSTYTQPFSLQNPVEGADKNQLTHMRDLDGNPLVPNLNFGNATAFQSPFAAQIGARLKF